MKKGHKSSKRHSGTMIVTEQDYQKQVKKGIHSDALLKPGTYKLKRGSFVQLHGGADAELRDAEKPYNIKVGVYIKLDLDVLNFFKARAGRPGGLPYQTQINAELRKVMEGNTDAGIDIEKLARDEKLISAIAERVRKRNSASR